MLSAINQIYSRLVEPLKKRFGQSLFIALWFCLIGIASSAAQTSPSAGNVVLVQNVRVIDGKGGQLIDATVLISGGKMTLVTAALPAPAGAVVIDGGGNILILDASGKIILRSDAASAVLKYQPKPQNINPAIALAAGELDRNRSELYSPLPLNSDSVPAVIAKNTFSSRGNLDSRQTQTAIYGTNRKSLNKFSEEQTSQQTPPEDNLAQKVTDPSAGLSTITFQNKFVPSLWGIDDDENDFDVQIAVPYKLGGKRNIFRATIPYFTNTHAPGNNGIGDVSLLNLTILPQSWGNFLIGPVVSFGNNKGPGVDTFAIGPSIGAVLKKGKWTYGFLNQNLFSFGGDIKTTQIQPILAYTVSEKISLAVGDAQFTVNWNRKKFVSAPFSAQVNYIHMFGKQPVRFFFNAQYNFINEFGAHKWTLTPAMAFILR
ncbi:MAG TPA: hypothetical protein VGC97_16870 [Pyrinomonadaceae bacterium]|jgi:hypothetical protein